MIRYHITNVTSYTQVKATRLEHGKKAFGPVIVDQLYGYVQGHGYYSFRIRDLTYSPI